jgi:hypothetical protein
MRKASTLELLCLQERAVVLLTTGMEPDPDTGEELMRFYGSRQSTVPGRRSAHEHIKGRRCLCIVCHPPTKNGHAKARAEGKAEAGNREET